MFKNHHRESNVHLTLRTFLCLVLFIMSISLYACGDEEGVVDVKLNITPLLNANLSQASLPNSGTLKVTAFDVDTGRIRKQESKSFDLGAKSGNLGKLDFGTWRFYIEAASNNETFYGVTAPFEVTNDSSKVTVNAIVGKSNCVGLLPPQRQSKDFPGSIELIAPYVGIAAHELPDGRVLITGGGTIDQSTGLLQGISNEIQIYDHRYGMIMRLDVALQTPRAYHQITALPDGRLLVSGGVSSLPMGRYQPTNQLEIISLKEDGSVVVTPSVTVMTQARYNHQSLLLSDGTVLLAGGIGDPLDDTPNYLQTAMRYFPVEDQVRAQGSMSEAKAYMTLTSLGRMSEVAVAIGGLNDAGASNKIEIFSINPQQACDRTGAAADQGCFISFDLNLNEARWGHNAVTLERNTNTVLITGGFASGNPNSPSGVLGSVEALSLNVTNGVAEFQVKSFLNLLTTNSRGLASIFHTYNDEVVMIGGFNGGSQNQLTRFSPVFDTNNQLISVGVSDEGLGDQCILSEARYQPTVVGTRDHGILILGGVKRGTLNGQVVHIASKRVEMYYPQLPPIETRIP